MFPIGVFMIDSINEVEIEETVEVKEEFVSKKAYSDVSSDMHKFKNKLKETEAKLNELQAKEEITKKQALQEQGKWEELYKKTQEQLDGVQSIRKQESDKFVDYHKMNAVLNQVGGFKRDEYNKFVDLKNVAMNEDGSIEESSLISEVQRIKQAYPELIKGSTLSVLPSEAPKAAVTSVKEYANMTEMEKSDFRLKLMQERNKK